MHRSRNYNPSKNYEDPFQSPRANPKHASYQVNGETQMRKNDIIMAVQRMKGGH